jgi:hypothetical protein
LALSDQVFYHKGEAIRLISQNIRDMNITSTEKLIGAIAILANCEVSS